MIHPSGIETTDYEKYEPTKWQIANAARRANIYHVQHRKPFPWWSLFLIGAGIYGLFWILSN